MPSFKDAFKGVRDVLVEFIDVDHGLLNKLIDKEVLTAQHVATIKANQTKFKRAEEMLDILILRPDDKLSAFKDALIETKQQHIWDKCSRESRDSCTVQGQNTEVNNSRCVATEGIENHLRICKPIFDIHTVFSKVLNNNETNELNKILQCRLMTLQRRIELVLGPWHNKKLKHAIYTAFDGDSQLPQYVSILDHVIENHQQLKPHFVATEMHKAGCLTENEMNSIKFETEEVEARKLLLQNIRQNGSYQKFDCFMDVLSRENGHKQIFVDLVCEGLANKCYVNPTHYRQICEFQSEVVIWLNAKFESFANHLHDRQVSEDDKQIIEDLRLQWVKERAIIAGNQEVHLETPSQTDDCSKGYTNTASQTEYLTWDDALELMKVDLISLREILQNPAKGWHHRPTISEFVHWLNDYIEKHRDDRQGLSMDEQNYIEAILEKWFKNKKIIAGSQAVDKDEEDALEDQLEQMRKKVEAFGEMDDISTINELKMKLQLDVALSMIAELKAQSLLSTTSMFTTAAGGEESTEVIAEMVPGLVGWFSMILFARDVACGLEYLHAMTPTPVVHGDIKVHNVLVAEGFVAKIGSFGFSKWKQFSTAYSPPLSPHPITNVPPELFASRTTKSDVYGFAILLWQMFSRSVPFEQRQYEMIRSAVISGQRPPIDAIRGKEQPFMPDQMFKLAKRIIEHCWKSEANERPDIKEVHTEFNKFLNENITDVNREIKELELAVAAAAAAGHVSRGVGVYVPHGPIDKTE